ncbi:MAG: MotA/TolQ/ExbB proton channel family protein [Thermoleophilaceae bacterium]|nr:MotA/TolQ/ExbB proton channel family protein [Thermoleophilaceae bacterium]
MILLLGSLGTDLTNAVANVAEALRYPVLILALLAAIWDIYELGRLLMEYFQRRQKDTSNFAGVAQHAFATAKAGDGAGAQALLKSQAHGEHLQRAYINTLLSPSPLDSERAAVEYDLYCSKRLDRVRLLVRAGPALGLMGTLIPLAPALAALGEGDVKVLGNELQTAFAITVVGVAVGLIAFVIALVHERFYSRDLANVEYLRQLRGDAPVIIQSSTPSLSDQAVTHVAVGATAAAAAAKPAQAPPAPAPAAAPAQFIPQQQPPQPQQAQPAPAAVPGQQEKKRFGIKKKAKAPEAQQDSMTLTGAVFPPAAPAAPTPPAVPAPPAAPGTPGQQGPDDGDKTASIPIPPQQ